ncbi:MAG: SIR2 family protein [Petrimonas sp.]|uniref:SIR2 family NAD-dependent protein deacylase n=1 Tax=Petrimonas sp. TaxID=2023866 RepID=UPI002B3B412F|nr:SIR2 family protein [Petrimonas sp.]
MKDKEYLLQLIGSKDILLFIGAGFSISSELPSGSALKNLLAQDVQKLTNLEMSDKSLQDICDVLQNKMGQTKFISLLASYLNKPSADTSAHDLLACIPFFDNIVTTNYDTFIEDALGDKCIVKVGDENLGIQEKGRICIYKIHGDFSHPKHIVVSKNDYAKFSNEPSLIWNEVKGLMSKKAILFIGYSIDDIHVYYYLFEIIKCLRKKDKKHRHTYYVAPSISKEDNRLLRSRGITPINSTGKNFLSDLDNYLKSSVVSLYKKKETDMTSLSSYMAIKNIFCRLSSSEQALTDFKPLDSSKPFVFQFNFGLGIPTFDKENLKTIGEVTDEGGLKIPVSHIQYFSGTINETVIMDQSDINFIELLPQTEKIDIRYTDTQGRSIMFPKSICYKNSFSHYDLRFIIKRKLYEIKLDLNFVQNEIKGTFTLSFNKVSIDHTGLKEELKELMIMTAAEGGTFYLAIKDHIIPLPFKITAPSEFVKEAIIYYTCLNKLVIEENLRIYEYPVYSHENLSNVLVLYSYYFEVRFYSSIMYYSENITFSSDLDFFPETINYIDEINKNHHAFKMLGEIKDFSFAGVEIRNIYSCMVIQNSLKQEIKKEPSGRHSIEIMAKTSDILFLYADSEEKIERILSKPESILNFTNSYLLL